MKRWPAGDFAFRGPDDFVRLDGLCAELLADFYAWLQSPQGGGLSPEEASPLAHAADRYLRDFVVDVQETGPSDPDPRLPRAYLANWYIVNTLEPSHREVDLVRTALGLLFRYLAGSGVLAESEAGALAANLEDEEFFHRRLDEFWDLTPDAIPAWLTVADYRAGRKASNRRGPR